ncbi:CoA transferase [Trebonia kvetii]|uniref:CoA transferase n=2 Tax=Trebonia kvetii TaxID=2480626 RepID=A0A6P2C000_9ACTN|nr:CoA transferase [Trebonia kvetii]
MALTGMPGGPPVASAAPVLAMLAQVTAEFGRVTADSGTAVQADPAELIAGRAALAGFTRGGRVSAGGSSFLLRAADGWCAVTVSRPDDVAAVPAIAGALGLAVAGGDAVETRAQARTVLAAAAASTPAEEFAAAAQLVGVPAAALPSSALASSALASSALGARVRPPAPGGTSLAGASGTSLAGAAGWPPWRTTRIAAPAAGATLAGAVVADLSSMWAGPLCSRLLGLAGAEVIKVESPARPDGARSGNREFFDWLHAGHRSLSVDFGTRTGRTALAALLEVADVVIEASRPRALAAAGLAPDMIAHRPGQVWLSITGYGRSMPERVAFGDDAAVAGGLVGWTTGGGYGQGGWGAGAPHAGEQSSPPYLFESSPEPVFCADAIADPLTAACGALAVALSLSAGGGELIDLPMREVAAAFAAAALDHGPHDVLPGGSVACPRSHRAQAVLPPRRPAPPAGPAAHAPELGADTSAVLAWLARRPAAC